MKETANCLDVDWLFFYAFCYRFTNTLPRENSVRYILRSRLFVIK